MIYINCFFWPKKFSLRIIQIFKSLSFVRNVRNIHYRKHTIDQSTSTHKHLSDSVTSEFTQYIIMHYVNNKANKTPLDVL